MRGKKKIRRFTPIEFVNFMKAGKDLRDYFPYGSSERDRAEKSMALLEQYQAGGLVEFPEYSSALKGAVTLKNMFRTADPEYRKADTLLSALMRAYAASTRQLGASASY